MQGWIRGWKRLWLLHHLRWALSINNAVINCFTCTQELVLKKTFLPGVDNSPGWSTHLVILTNKWSVCKMVIYFQRIKLCFPCLFHPKKFQLFISELVITLVTVHQSGNKKGMLCSLYQTYLWTPKKKNLIKHEIFLLQLLHSIFMCFHYIYIESVLINGK